MKRVLIVEDEESLASALQFGCEEIGCQVHTVFSGHRARQALTAQDYDAVVVDIGLPDCNGLSLLEYIAATIPVLVITAHGNLNNAVRARKSGAADYLVKPFDLATFTDAVEQLLHVHPSEISRDSTPAAEERIEQSMMIGAAAVMQPVYSQIAYACTCDRSVLISGPAGSGKTLCARAIHQNSIRRDQELRYVSAADESLPALDLLRGGTLLLEDIADFSASAQDELYGWLMKQPQNQADGIICCRVIAATAKDMQQEVAAGRFHEELYHLLNDIQIQIPALRDRMDDLHVLCSYFMGESEQGRQVLISDEAYTVLKKYDWPDNIRELRHVVEQAVIACPGMMVDVKQLPETLLSVRERQEQDTYLRQCVRDWVLPRLAGTVCYEELHDEVEKILLEELLRQYKGKSTAMARALKINRATLLKKRRKLGLE